MSLESWRSILRQAAVSSVSLWIPNPPHCRASAMLERVALASTAILAFYGEVDGTRYPALLLKQSGTKVFLSTWCDGPGTVIVFGPTRAIALDVVETHETLPPDGRLHITAGMKDGSRRTLREKPEGWIDHERTIPLDSIPWETLDPRWKQGPWNDANAKIITLRSRDFGNAAGVNLVVCFAAPGKLAALKKRWINHWVLRGGRTMIVGAEPIPMRPEAKGQRR
jgi:hypothetical protein